MLLYKQDMYEIINLNLGGLKQGHCATLLLLSMEHLAVQRGRHMVVCLHRQSGGWMGRAMRLMVDMALKTYLAHPAPWRADICPCGSTETEMAWPRGQTRPNQYVDGLQFDLMQPLGLSSTCWPVFKF